MNLNSIHNVYFVGIGGIGMSALARYFKFNQKNVAGYDKTKTEITDALVALGIQVSTNDNVAEIPEAYLNKENTIIIYTPAIPSSHSELTYFKENDFNIYKRAEVLGLITKDTYCLAVAGTHGKTTTSSILGHLLAESEVDVTAFLGGIAENYNSNLILKGNEITVVEADEFDRSFLQLSPDIACITSTDADHLDIYGKKEALHDSFLEFTKRIKPNGTLFIQEDIELDGITYGFKETSDYHIKNIKIQDGSYVFDIVTPTAIVIAIQFHLPGRHNLLNGLVAFAMADKIGTPTDRLAKALGTFKGVKRRFSYQIRNEDFVFIDDYAHHPTEINALYQAVREMYPDKKVTAIFQPHLFSRTKDFADEFAESLAKFDEIILLEIYPAREKPIEGITSSWLLSKIKNDQKQLLTKENLINHISTINTDVLLTVGAGDIGAEVLKIKNLFTVEN
ncbi:UDP-N-acetylmuramate--L-alanine ligase [Kordia sp. YSTF-M3]|uniref:UDP-N-acetylmuramate--L-alanine ligase n=1 Tax=Kordia aestuariivivens TaxID=2759037 RepID=A0ABR7Q452_9FLAO|nr:UDP-N-acetylmuramate--L-alanine ligase [Kordia aestuariivivens]MBC8753331.1 UDP-N-acetylmuramate--L-alanine ligase [Kordia aestuariivivens]